MRRAGIHWVLKWQEKKEGSSKKGEKHEPEEVKGGALHLQQAAHNK